MIRPPPRSTLFPYPPLSRSPSETITMSAPATNLVCLFMALLRGPLYCGPGACQPVRRSEEHTSELQSQSNLVCRLLLEKKKINSWTVLLALAAAQRDRRSNH